LLPANAEMIPITGTAPDDDERAMLPQVVVIGAAGFDIKGRVTSDRVFEGSSNAGELTMGVGGVARNVAENLARLDVPTTLIAAVADDMLGEMVVQRTRDAGVDTDLVLSVPGARTGAYLGLLAPEGDVLMGIDDMGIVRRITPRVVRQARRILRGAGIVVMDANLPTQTIRTVRRICSAAAVPVCIEPVSLPLIGRIVPCIPGSALFTPNVAEAEAILGCTIATLEEAQAAALAFREWDIDIVVVTLGGGGAVYATSEGSGHVPAIQTDIVDESGAGAAMTAGIICGLMHRFPIDEAIALGASAASLTLLSPETVRSDISLEQVYEHLVV
ncbi:MAG TPA: carbohydrate kinase family protein, partial [Thermomicrobiales bacterium]